MKIKLLPSTVVALALFSGASHATLITTNSMTVTDDFSNYTSGWNFTSGPITLNSGAVWSTTYGSSVIGNSSYGLAGNGSWNSARNGYTGLNTNIGSMTFLLPQEVNYVGGFINYATSNYADVIMEALDIYGNVLESYNINQLAAISTPNTTNQGAFRGISRTTFDISSLRVSNGYVVLDDLTFGDAKVSDVPVPATLWLVGLGITLLGFSKRKV